MLVMLNESWWQRQDFSPGELGQYYEEQQKVQLIQSMAMENPWNIRFIYIYKYTYIYI